MPSEDLTIISYPKLNLINIKMNDNAISSTIISVVNIEGLTIDSTYTFKYILSNIIYEQNNLDNEELNYWNEISVFLSELPNQVTNL